MSSGHLSIHQVQPIVREHKPSEPSSKTLPTDGYYEPPPEHPFLGRCRKAKEEPFLDERPLVGNPSCSIRDFRHPLLRRCPFEEPRVWKSQLGCGIDGVVWEVQIGDRVFALKVFWDNVAPPDTAYWAIQRQCHNIALLQMMQTAVQDSTEPIHLIPEPKTFRGATANLGAFSDEGRQRHLHRDREGAVPCTSIPRLRECYGWTKISAKELCSLPREMRPHETQFDRTVRRMSAEGEYYALVYEFVPHGDIATDITVAQPLLDFFWLVGFCFAPFLRKENWSKSGLLLDLADLICPWHAGWFQLAYKPYVASRRYRLLYNDRRLIDPI